MHNFKTEGGIIDIPVPGKLENRNKWQPNPALPFLLFGNYQNLFQNLFSTAS
jgi:hypothetical protein